MNDVLAELVYGQQAHSSPLVCVDVDAEAAGGTPPGFAHSIHQLVGHMCYWMEHELARIDGRPAPYPEHAAESWPPPRPSSPAAWTREIERFANLLARMAELAKRPANERARPVAATHQSESRHASVEAILFQTVAHNSYHLGQVVQVRHGLALWPPPKGSDTW